MVFQILQVLFETFKVIFTTFFGTLPILKELSDLKANVILNVLGISYTVFALAILGIKVIKVVIKKQ